MAVKIDEFAKKLEEEYDSYLSCMNKDIQEEITQIAKETVAEIKENSPVKTGKYKNGWKCSVGKKNNFSGKFEVKIYNKNSPQIAHLLEFGHLGRDGTERGKAEPHGHILKARDNALKKLENLKKEL